MAHLRERLMLLFEQYQLESQHATHVPALQLQQQLLIDIRQEVVAASHDESPERTLSVRCQQLEINRAQMQQHIESLDRQLYEYHAALLKSNTEKQQLHNEKARSQQVMSRQYEQAMIDRNELGLRLAKAYRIRPGTRETIINQFQYKGIRNEVIERLVSELDFCRELNKNASPRRSRRLTQQKQDSDTEA
ncbi:hypothetical protein LTR64_008760 [Lithohypha guttulata]|uniref:uncharacterized protein n=1 Tax=Lithohypha guttulata TaxID=1690604 RepID=UPI00315C6B48